MIITERFLRCVSDPDPVILPASLKIAVSECMDLDSVFFLFLDPDMSKRFGVCIRFFRGWNRIRSISDLTLSQHRRNPFFYYLFLFRGKSLGGSTENIAQKNASVISPSRVGHVYAVYNLVPYSCYIFSCLTLMRNECEMYIHLTFL